MLHLASHEETLLVVGIKRLLAKRASQMSYCDLWSEQKDAIFPLSSEMMFSDAYTGMGKYPCYSSLLDYLEEYVNCRPLQSLSPISSCIYISMTCTCRSLCDDILIISNVPWAPVKRYQPFFFAHCAYKWLASKTSLVSGFLYMLLYMLSVSVYNLKLFSIAIIV